MTNFFGAGAGRTCQKVSYKTLDLGALYRHSDRDTYAFMLRNAAEHTKPRYLTVGFARRCGEELYAVDSEYIFGTYGANENRRARFWLIRAGMEKRHSEAFTTRLGLIYPIKAFTSSLGNIKANIPSPGFGASLGFGYRSSQGTSVDIAFYGDPARSYIEHKAKLGVTMSLSQRLK